MTDFVALTSRLREPEDAATLVVAVVMINGGVASVSMTDVTN